jgi:membrane protease YdiL (CAAX protease family)
MPTEPEWSRELPFAARLLLVAVFLFVIVSVWAVLANLVLEASGFFAWLYGLQPVAVAQTPGQAGPEAESLRARMGLWASAAAFPFWVASVAAFFRWVRLVAPADIGLTLGGAARNILYGAGAAVVLAPLVLGLNYGAVWLFKDVLQWPVQEHPLAFAGRHGLSAPEWVLLAFAVMVSAPLSEELVFRGALQRLFLYRPWGPHVAMSAALLMAIARQPPPAATPTSALDVLAANVPALFVAALVPVYLVVWLCSRPARTPEPFATSYPDVEPSGTAPAGPNAAPAVFATALLFAAVHSFAWPTPVALFVLGLGLGYLALWTRSLVAPIMLHSLFNGASYVLLLAGWGG